MSAAAGAPQLGSIMTPEGRRSARLAAKAELMSGNDAITDDTLAEGLADAIVAAEEVTGKTITGGKKHKLRGGSETVNAIKGLVKGLFNKTKSVVGAIDKALGNVISIGIPTAAFVGTTVVVLNHPTVLGNLSQLVALTLAKGTNVSVTSTWGQWGKAVTAVGDALKVLGEAVIAQSLQGPVVPVAIAIAILMWRANKNGETFTEVVKGDAAFLSSKVARVITGQIQAFNEAKEAKQKQIPIDQLKNLAKRAKIPTLGEGAPMTTMLALSSGAPAVEPSKLEETVSLVRGTQEKDYKIALKPLIGITPGSVQAPAVTPVETKEEAESEVDGMNEEDALSLLAAVALMEEAAETNQKVELSPAAAPKPSLYKRPGTGPMPTQSKVSARQRIAAFSAPGMYDSSSTQVFPPPAPASSLSSSPSSSSSSSSTTPGGRRRKTRGKKSKRRVTRRLPRLVKFAY